MNTAEKMFADVMQLLNIMSLIDVWQVYTNQLNIYRHFSIFLINILSQHRGFDNIWFMVIFGN